MQTWKREIHALELHMYKSYCSPPQKAVKDNIDNRKSDMTPDFEFDEINNDELVSACVEAEGVEGNKVENVEIVYRRTGCNRWENIYSRILM